MPFEHEAVCHSVGEYVRDQAHVNGMESFWSMLKRGYYGTYHHMSAKHLDRYVGEFSGRHNDRNADTIDQMARMAQGMVGKRLSYRRPDCLTVPRGSWQGNAGTASPLDSYSREGFSMPTARSPKDPWYFHHLGYE